MDTNGGRFGSLGFTYSGSDILCMLGGEPCLLVQVLEVFGSSPRGVGAWMVVSESRQFNSIGGGHLEHYAVERARLFLRRELPLQASEVISLGARLGQCCGGRVKLGFRRFSMSPVGAPDPEGHSAHGDELTTSGSDGFEQGKGPCVAIAGMGHVGSALAHLLAPFPIKVYLADTREDRHHVTHRVGHYTTVDDDLSGWVERLPDRTHLFIMTHRHDLDRDILLSALDVRRRRSRCFDGIGLIGSQTKWRRFSEFLRRKGFSEDELAFVQCPIGGSERGGSKQPGRIALQVVSSLTERLSRDYRSLFA